MFRKSVLALLVTALLSPGLAAAQTGSSGIVGVVRDSGGGAIPGVTVEVSSPVLIERSKTTTTGARGEYQVIDLRPGTYSVTFTLQGFQTVRQEGIFLAADFTATVDVELPIGSVSETLTVTGESPIVDVRSATSERALNQQLIEGVPTGRVSWGVALLVPGATSQRPDIGGTEGGNITSFSIHGTASRDQQWNADGLDITSNLGSTIIGAYYNQGLYEQVSVQTKALPAEIAVGGVNANVVTKEGGNTFRSELFASFTGDNLQSSNVSDEQRELGLTHPSGVDTLYDINGGVGGPILRDRLWFFGSYRRLRVDRLEAQTFDVDGRTQSLDEQLLESYSGKLTFQLDSSNRVSSFIDYLNKIRDHDRRRTTTYQFISPEASYRSPTWGPTANVKWTSTVRNNLLLEGGFALFHAFFSLNYNPEAAFDAFPRNDLTLSTLSGASVPAGIGNPGRPERRTWSFVTSWLPTWAGSHSIRTGVQYYHTPFSKANVTGSHGDFMARYRSGVPDSVIAYNTPFEYRTDMHNVGLFVQDAWNLRQRVTFNAGVRYERLWGNVNETRAPSGTFVPERHYPRLDMPVWNTIVPRLAVVFDVFGDSRTAIKANVSKYMQRQGSGLPDQVNPARLNTETRSWVDGNGDRIPQLTEIGAGRGELDRGANVRFDPNLELPYQWEYTVTLEHQVARSFAVATSYFYRKHYRDFVTKNVALQPSDYSPVTVVNPLDGQPFTIYNQNPATSGRVDNVLMNSDVLGGWYHGFEVTAERRFANNFMLFGGVTIGSFKNCTSDSTNPNANINSCGYDSFDSTYLTNLSGTYRLPQNFTVSAHIQHASGKPLRRLFVYTRAHVPTLTQVSEQVSLLPSGDVRRPGQTLLDVRLSRAFSGGRVRFEPLLDFYNLLNENAAVEEVEVVGPTLGAISRNLDGRIFKVGLRLSF